MGGPPGSAAGAGAEEWVSAESAGPVSPAVAGGMLRVGERPRAGRAAGAAPRGRPGDGDRRGRRGLRLR